MVAGSTPDALWRAPSLQLLKPATVVCRGVSSGRLLDRCSLAITAGERLVLVGDPPEAASLLLRILAGLVRPRRGSVSVAGIEGPASTAGGRRAAYVPHVPALPPWMTPREALRLAASLLSMSGGPARLAIERAAEHARISADELDDPLSVHGRDVAERTDLAAALVGDPEVLLLEEPLPSVGASERAELLRFGGERRSVVMTSRSPERDAGLATHVGLLRGGRVVLFARVEEFRGAGMSPTVDVLGELVERFGPQPPNARASRSGGGQ